MRKAREITQARLADLAGISAGYVGLLETGDRGNHPSRVVVRRIAQALGANLEETESLLRAGGHLVAGESLFALATETSFVKFVNDYPVLTPIQKATLIGIAETWGILE
jgi:transcriptional regulator with XRE-family HTH domain